MRSKRIFFAFLAAAALVAACSSAPLATQLATPPEFLPKDQTKARVAASPLSPLVVEWPSADRATLESSMRQRVVVVRYVGDAMTVLGNCRSQATYGYTGTTQKSERVTIQNRGELFATIPVHAASFEGKLASVGRLDVDMATVGRYQAYRSRVWRDELDGDCEGATHAVVALTVGAFDFFAGGEGSVAGGGSILGAGAGARESTKRETLNRDGDRAACQKATSKDAEPPQGCAAALRLELRSLEGPEGGQRAGACPAHVNDYAGCTARCEAGSPVACASLAFMYYNGEGAPSDPARAVALYESACKAGWPVACMNLGIAYINAKGVQKNQPRGRDLVVSACDMGWGPACFYYGGCYAFEKAECGLPRSRSGAKEYFEKACRRGDPSGCGALKAFQPSP